MAKKRTNKKNSKNNNASIGFLFWIALILFAIVVILFNKNDLLKFWSSFKKEEAKPSVIAEKEKNASTSEKKKEPLYETVKVPEKKSKKPEVVVIPKETPATKQESPISLSKPKKEPLTSKEKDRKVPPKEGERTNVPKEKNTQAKPVKKTPLEKESPPLMQQLGGDSNKKYRNYKLYYVLPTDSNPLHLQAIVREIAFEDSPLTATLQSLFQGVKASEFKQFPEMISAIPQGSQIHSIKIVKGNAIINLNSAFTQNIFSKEGMEASLKQIIYTATEFPSVDSVQILIDGRSQEYLGQEGVYIQRPLYRNSFR